MTTDPDAFVDGVRDRNETALSRLGSSKSLYADTAGEMETSAVLDAAATAEYRAAETFEQWADDADGAARDAWAESAAEERAHHETVAAELDGEHDPGPPSAIHDHLRGLTDPVERAGAFVGRTLAAEASKSQLTGFFVGQADPQTASTFRGLTDDLDAQLERAVDLLATLCADEGDWERAADAADAADQTAYEEYTETLESLGVNPKPVC
jgi:hypothetical protein